MWNPPPEHPLRRLFAGLAEHAFFSHLGVADPALTDYVPCEAVLKARLGVGALTQEDRQDVVAQLAKADIRLDPRFGTINPQTGGLEKQQPNWIKPTATAPTPP